MFSKSVLASVLLLAFSLQVHGHAAVAPALGVSGTPVRGDVQRPSTANPCGKVNIAKTLDTSTPVQAAADGTFTATALDFNAGADGSRSVSAEVDATGTGKSFVAAKVTTNGNPKPATVGSDKIVAALPAGTKCTGGAAKDKCLVSFKTTAGFGNCVVVQQGGAAKGKGNVDVATTNSTAAAAPPAKHGSEKGEHKKDEHKKDEHKHRKGKKQTEAKAYGTRAPRALLDAIVDLEARGEEAVAVAKRGLINWIWA